MARLGASRVRGHSARWCQGDPRRTRKRAPGHLFSVQLAQQLSANLKQMTPPSPLRLSAPAGGGLRRHHGRLDPMCGSSGPKGSSSDAPRTPLAGGSADHLGGSADPLGDSSDPLGRLRPHGRLLGPHRGGLRTPSGGSGSHGLLRGRPHGRLRGPHGRLCGPHGGDCGPRGPLRGPHCHGRPWTPRPSSSFRAHSGSGCSPLLPATIWPRVAQGGTGRTEPPELTAQESWPF